MATTATRTPWPSGSTDTEDGVLAGQTGKSGRSQENRCTVRSHLQPEETAYVPKIQNARCGASGVRVNRCKPISGLYNDAQRTGLAEVRELIFRQPLF